MKLGCWLMPKKLLNLHSQLKQGNLLMLEQAWNRELLLSLENQLIPGLMLKLHNQLNRHSLLILEYWWNYDTLLSLEHPWIL